MVKKKIASAIFSFVLILVAVFMVSSCTIQQNQNIKSIEIVEGTIPDYIVIGEFNEAGIKAKVTYEDDTSKIIDITTDLLMNNYKEQLTSSGDYTVEILYRGKTLQFSVHMVDVKELHEVRFYNGNNELISLQLVETGKDAVAPEYNAYAMNGYTFVGWDRLFTKVDADINVYGIYSKVTTGETGSANYEEVLNGALDNMIDVDNSDYSFINVSEVWELAGKRFDTTLRYIGSPKQLVNATSKVSLTSGENSLYYEQVVKEGSEYNYSRISNTGIYKDSQTAAFMAEYDVYNTVKGLMKLDGVSYSTQFSAEKENYLLVVSVPNTNGGTHDATEYEVLFNRNQVLSIKEYQCENRDLVVRTLKTSSYYTINIEDEEHVLFPGISSLSGMLGDIYNQDVIIQVKEQRDMLTLVKKVQNNAEDKVALVTENGVTTYIWKAQDFTYYTKEELNESNSSVDVYKTSSSESAYGKEFYYYYKNNCSSLNDFEIVTTSAGTVEYIFEVPESSASPAYTVSFEVKNNQVIAIRKSRLNGDANEIFEITTFDYQETYVTLPQVLEDSMPNAITE